MKLEKILKYKKGKSPDKEILSSNLILYLSPEYLRGKGKPNFIPDFASKVVVKDGDLLLLWDGSNAGEFFKGKDGYLSSTMVKFIFDRSEYNPEFLFYQLKNYEGHLKTQTNGSGIPHVDKEILLNLIVQQFTKSEQTRIAQILSKADEAIAQTEALIAKYQRIKTGLMQDLLTRGIDENGNIRSKATHQFVVKNGMEVPVEWEVAQLGEIINAIDPQPDHRTPSSVENGIPYLGINDVDDCGNIDYRKCRKVSPLVLKEHKRRYQLRVGDIIFGKIGTIGEPKRFIKLEDVTLSANIILIQPKENSDYIYWLLNSDFMNRQIKDSIQSTTQPAFGMEKIRKLIVPIAEIKEQEIIADKLNNIKATLESFKQNLTKLHSLKKGLMQDLLSGKVRVE